jgi:hypothetical protein
MQLAPTGARRKSLTTVKDGNCFVEGSDFAAVNRVAARFAPGACHRSIARMGHHGYLHFCREYVLPARDDHVPEAIDDRDVPLSVHEAEIAGVERSRMSALSWAE